MITIQSYGSKQTSTMSQINKDNSILLIGRASNEYKLNEFIKPNGLSEMTRLYGDSDLTDAYRIAATQGADNVFVMNCFKSTDFIDTAALIGQYNFAYVVPVGITLSDMFYNSEYDRDMFFAEHYLNQSGTHNNSLILFTDSHASLYEDIDACLSDMHIKVDHFKQHAHYVITNKGRNICFCLNNLKNIKYANVVLAAQLSIAAIGDYPNTISQEAIYDIDNLDIMSNEIIYFKNNIHTNTSIENLKNFRTISDANKLIAIDRVIRHIERTLDTSFVLGKLYNQYVKMLLHDYLDEYFRKLSKSAISNYCIKAIEFVKTKDMYGYITVDIDIQPINSLEAINTLLEVK